MKFRRLTAVLALFFFAMTMLPAEPVLAATVKTEMSGMMFVNSSGKSTNMVGEAVALQITFTATNDREKPLVELDDRIELLPKSLQPDQDKIEQIIGNIVTLKPGLPPSERVVTLKFLKPPTVATVYQIPVRVSSKPINPGNQVLELVADVAVLVKYDFNSANNQQEHTTFTNAIKMGTIPKNPGKNEAITGYNFTGKLTLQLKDKYDNFTNKIPAGQSLAIKFEPRKGKTLADYKITTGDPNIKITDAYQLINQKDIPSDPHSLGQLNFNVTIAEDNFAGELTDMDFAYVPKIYAALANKTGETGDTGSGAIMNNTEIISRVGFIPKTIQQGEATLEIGGNVQTGAKNNQMLLKLTGVYPGAGKVIEVTLPKGYRTAKGNTVEFGYDDIEKYKILDLTAIPQKLNSEIKLTEKDFKVAVKPKSKDPSDTISWVLGNNLMVMSSGLVNSAKSKLVLSKPAAGATGAQANNQDMVNAILQLKDVNGMSVDGASDQILQEDYHIYLWAEREAGKVSQTEAIVKAPDGANIVSTVGEENGVAGVYKVDEFTLSDATLPAGDMIFGITSTADGMTTIKAAIAPDALSALQIRSPEGGLVSNTIKAKFLPYAATDTWLFKDVKVGGIKDTAMASNNNSYQVLVTKKSNGADKFANTALLSSPKGNVKLAGKKVNITCSDSNLNITSAAKDAVKIPGGLQVITDNTGKIAYNLTSSKNGKYTVTVKSVEGGATYTMQVSYDDAGGTSLEDNTSPGGDFDALLKTVTKVVLVEQSSYLLAEGDTLYARFRLYNKAGKEIVVKNDTDAKKAVSTLLLPTKPIGSTVIDGKDKDMKITADDGGIMITFIADKLGKYGMTLTIPNGKNAKASFNVDQTDRIIGMRLSYEALGLDLGETSGPGSLIFTNSKGIETVKPIPVAGISLSASGKALEKFEPATGITRARKGDQYSGTVITVRATDRAHNLEASYQFVVGHDIIPLEFSNTVGTVHQTLKMTAKIQDDADRSLPIGALNAKNGAQVSISVLSKPKDAVVKTELADNGNSFILNGLNVIKVRSDRIGKVSLRVDVRAVDPNYSTKYPIYTYLSGIVELDFKYPGILDSTPFIDGYSTASAALMYIGSNTYLNQGKEVYMDAPPFIQDDRTFIPVRALGDALNAQTNYNANNQSISIYSGGTTMNMMIGSPIITTNNKGNVNSDVVPFIRDGRTYLPLRVVAELFGCKVEAIYDDQQVIGVVFVK